MSDVLTPPRRRLSGRDFEAIRRLAYGKFGLDLKQGKEELVAARLGRKLREHSFGSFEEYYRWVEADPTGEALIGLIDALTTNHTSFLREPAHFDFLRDTVVPALARRSRIDIWSAACSSGEEPYTIACALIEAGVDPSRIRILATDISTRVLEKARRGVYPEDRFHELPDGWRRKYLLRGTGQWEGWMRFRPEVRGTIEFQRLNLMEPFAHAAAFPVIFCRNVMIYFDKPTQEHVVRKMARALEPGGWLLVGHAESLTAIDHELRYVKPAIYRRPEGGARR